MLHTKNLCVNLLYPICKIEKETFDEWITTYPKQRGDKETTKTV